MKRNFKFTVGVPSVLVGAWLAMLGLGMAHATVGGHSLGYLPVLLVMVGASFAKGYLAKFEYSTKHTTTTRRRYR